MLLGHQVNLLPRRGYGHESQTEAHLSSMTDKERKHKHIK
jgi:hypothetical protein